MHGDGIREQINKTTVLGREIRIHVLDTGAGLNVLIEGGDKAHIGAVAVAGPGLPVQSRMNAPEQENPVFCMAFPEHREDVVCRRWAEALSPAYEGPVVIAAGIHYDGVDKAQIGEILAALETELERVLCALKNGR